MKVKRKLTVNKPIVLPLGREHEELNLGAMARLINPKRKPAKKKTARPKANP